MPIFWSIPLITRSFFHVQFGIIKELCNMDFSSFIYSKLSVTRTQFYWVCLLSNILYLNLNVTSLLYAVSTFFFFFFSLHFSKLFTISSSVNECIFNRSWCAPFFRLGKWPWSKYFQQSDLPLQTPN